MDLIQLRQQFPIARDYIFLDAAAAAPMCRPAADEIAFVHCRLIELRRGEAS